MLGVISCKLRVIITLCTISGLYCNILHGANSLSHARNQLPPSWVYSQVCKVHTINLSSLSYKYCVHTINYGLGFPMPTFPPFETYVHGRYKLMKKDWRKGEPYVIPKLFKCA